MALINCPECGKEISDKAESCPNCGYPIAEEVVLKENSDENTMEEETEGKNDVMQGVLSIALSISGIIIALMTDGLVNIISLILFIISVVLGLKSGKKFSIIGILISGYGIASFLIDYLLLV